MMGSARYVALGYVGYDDDALTETMQALARDLAEKSARHRNSKREPGRSYQVYRRTVQATDPGDMRE